MTEMTRPSETFHEESEEERERAEILEEDFLGAAIGITQLVKRMKNFSKRKEIL